VTSHAVLFDFDGTLADSAPDLAAAVNRMRAKRNLEPLAVEATRAYVSMGARGMLRIGFGMTADDPAYAAMREEFLALYADAICVHTRLFSGMAEVLAELTRRSIAWGIVTNKAMRLTERIVPALGLAPACLVGGDSTPHLKPHPAPLLLAAQKLNLAPERCTYVGDDLRDIQAARAAGMRCIAVDYGYHGAEQAGPAEWNADATISHPSELLEHL
jgi:N-acetyl-D-muramate 6-phosphate phosphatase